MEVVFLGTGTSHGVPVIGCDCTVCQSKNKKDIRTRTSVIIKLNKKVLLIDAGPELRMQLLREKIKHVDHLLLTHAHSDHIAGIDDCRIFSERTKNHFNIYGPATALNSIRARFDYAFKKTQEGGGKPKLVLHPKKERFKIDDIVITPIPAWHGRVRVFGYRIGNFAYLTDVSAIPKSSYSLLEKLDVLVLDALRPDKHPTHFSLTEAIEEAKKIKAKRTFFTHICHLLAHQKTNEQLPRPLKLAYDGLKLSL